MAVNDFYVQLAGKIIKEQEAIIGPIALEQAKKVSGLEIVSEGDIKISGNAKEVLDSLVSRYAKLFGQASIEVCKEAVRSTKTVISKDDLPAILQ
jgi:predicted homoserine dehydrogenase-like protein